MKTHLLIVIFFTYLSPLFSQTEKEITVIPSCEFILTDGNSDLHLSAALSAIENEPCQSAIIRIKGEVSIENNHTINKNIDLIFDNGGFFKGEGELTINASIQAGLYKIFDVSGLKSSLTLKGSPSTDRIFPQWFGAKINDENSDCQAINAAVIFANQAGGGTIFFPSGEYTLTCSIDMKSNVVLEGEGDSSVLLNITNDKNSINAIGSDSDRIHGIAFKNLKIAGKDENNYSGKTGIHIEYSYNNEFDDNSSDFRIQRGDPITISDVTILNHKEHGIYFEDGSLLVVSNSTVENNKEFGIYVLNLSNHLELNNCVVSNNRKSGVYINQVASNCTILGTQFTRNSRYGIVLQRCEQPVISYNSFNNNFYGGINIVGDNDKYVDAPLIIGNLFGGNGIYNPNNVYEISMNYTKGASIISNYFYGVPYINTVAMINIGDNVKGCVISNNHWKELKNTTKKVRFGGTYSSQNVVFNDNNRTDGKQQIYSRNKYIEYLNDAKNSTVFQTKLRSTGEYDPPNFKLENGGRLNWGGGGAPTDIFLERLNSELMQLSSNLQTKTIGVKKINQNQVIGGAGSTYGTIFLDSADNKLKIKLPGGVIKTIKFE